MNVINPSFVEKLGLRIKQTEVDIQKIHGLSLEIFKVIIASFSIDDKAR